MDLPLRLLYSLANLPLQDGIEPASTPADQVDRLWHDARHNGGDRVRNTDPPPASVWAGLILQPGKLVWLYPGPDAFSTVGRLRNDAFQVMGHRHHHQSNAG